MTNTLHRQGTLENLQGDYVIFARPAAGINRDGCAPKLREFLRICLRHSPVNMGNEESLGIPREQWPEMIEKTTDKVGATAAFADLDALGAVLAELKEADLGISINISGLAQNVHQCARSAGITRHSIEHSLGVHGRTERLPAKSILEINTMCGHGMVSFNLVKKMIDYVKLGKLTPQEAANLLAKPCACGAFNTERAALLLERFRDVG